ncbi:enoyl-CoA hydratase/isomerase family protein [Mycobacterium avium subsp. avium 2285 (R)]|nr:enoyl-CoA hydratase/isomerase family protein [Mycobacterium avium subsp. avium 2285 (R)]
MSLVLVDHPRPGVALITLNRPERMNSMAFDVMVPLKEALQKVTYDNAVRVVVLTGPAAASPRAPTTSPRARCPTSRG